MKTTRPRGRLPSVDLLLALLLGGIASAPAREKKIEPSGSTGEGKRGGEPGSNGLTLVPNGRPVLRQHGERRSDGTIALLTKEMTRPNSLALSPDEKTFYVANDDPGKAIWMAFDVKDDGTLGKGRVSFDAATWVRAGKKGLPDGMKVDRAGDLFATGLGGVLVFDPDGTHLGTFNTDEATANCGLGEDGSTLDITADLDPGRVRLNTKGRVPGPEEEPTFDPLRP